MTGTHVASTVAVMMTSLKGKYKVHVASKKLIRIASRDGEFNRIIASPSGDGGCGQITVSLGYRTSSSCALTPASFKVRNKLVIEIAGMSASKLTPLDDHSHLPNSLIPADDVSESRNRAFSSKNSSTNETCDS